MKKLTLGIIPLLLVLLYLNCGQYGGGESEMLAEKIKQFVPTEIKFDASLLDDRQNKVVENLYQAALVMDKIFLQQVYSGNNEIREELQSSEMDVDAWRLEYFTIMFGPFDRLDHNKPFYGTAEKPKGANFYPEDMSKQEFLQWIEDHPDDEKSFTSEFTVIRRENGELKAVPYSEYFKEDLETAAIFLRQAAAFADNPTLEDFLIKRADAFLSNDYYQSDMAWMDLKDHLIEVVIGPYEVYEDEMFNYKAAFVCFITLRDPEESKKLAKFGNYLVDIEKNLPIPDKYKNFERGSESPIVVAQEIFTAGDTKAGVQTIAFNLPNDERVRKAKGSKKVMLKNVNQAKFDQILTPIAAQVLTEEQLPHVTFDAFFNHVLMHEMSHGVGPGFITVDGRDTEVKIELKETYSSIEECKADILGMYNIIFMIKKGEFPESFERETWATFLAGIFRSVRFGISEAHGAGNAIIYNYLLEKGGYVFDEQSQKVRVDFDKVYAALEELATNVLTLQATGDYEAARKLIEDYAVESPSMKILKDKLTDLPVDIKPVYQIEMMM
ncbi:MAG: peptidase [Calditrichae bacterium]|nr:peptidase [Calditrichia bacterium]